jgi:regulator of protease activity HflC (stomatin/prohibitin superfamily)
VNDLLQLVISIVTYLWPFRIVKSWERAVYRVNGKVLRSTRWWCSGAPGLKLVLPFFCEVDSHLVVPDPLSLPRQSLTLRDGRSLICQALMTMVVDDVVLAVEEVSGFIISAQEVAAGKIAERLMTAQPAELEPDNRGRLLGGLKQSINAELKKFGCRCIDLTFVQFAFAKTYRFFNDATSVGGVFDA